MATRQELIDSMQFQWQRDFVNTIFDAVVQAQTEVDIVEESVVEVPGLKGRLTAAEAKQNQYHGRITALEAVQGVPGGLATLDDLTARVEAMEARQGYAIVQVVSNDVEQIIPGATTAVTDAWSADLGSLVLTVDTENNLISTGAGGGGKYLATLMLIAQHPADIDFEYSFYRDETPIIGWARVTGTGGDQPVMLTNVLTVGNDEDITVRVLNYDLADQSIVIRFGILVLQRLTN